MGTVVTVVTVVTAVTVVTVETGVIHDRLVVIVETAVTLVTIDYSRYPNMNIITRIQFVTQSFDTATILCGRTDRLVSKLRI